MYTLLKNVNIKKLLTAETPAFGASLVVAETLYKFGSFIFECAAFLATWYLLSFLIDKAFFGKSKYHH
ncbi:MAG: hypothetical protein M3Y85_11450 [Bacteroidota bacterium]|nr:hypothetical protein [Bacteroidota bacterium]